MRMRPFGTRCGYIVPAASIGAMRLPRDVDEAVALIRHAIDEGMTYIDTSRGYGDSEIKIGKALKDGYRDRVILSTKWCPWNLKVEEDDEATAECVRKRLEESMRRLDVDVLDFYQVWSVNTHEQYELATRPGGMVEGILKAQEDGLVRHIGMTTHDTPASLMSYLDDIDWCEAMLFTYNLLNPTYAEVMAAARKRGIGVVVMNPVGGGRLAQPNPVLEQLATEVGAASVPDLAIRYLMSNPDIDTFISGISKIADVDDSIASANRGAFTGEELARIEAFLDQVKEQRAAFCTGCRYCLPCPREIDIPTIMSLNFDDRVLGFHDAARARYGKLEANADACAECGECETRCTQSLKITEEMRYAAEHYGKASNA